MTGDWESRYSTIREIVGWRVRRLGNIIYRLCRAAATVTTLVGLYWAYWAPDNKLLVFMIFLGPAVLCLGMGKFIRFILAQFEAGPSRG
jgi:hypothetical protein